MKRRIGSWISRYANRAGVIYALLAAAVFFFVDYKHVILRTNAATLSRLMPPFDHLLAIQDKDEKPDPVKIDQYLFYLRKLNELIAPRPDTYSLMAFCYYHLGKPEKALEYYDEAIKLYDTFFWFHYDKGLIYYQAGRYDDAARSFFRALKTELFNTLNFFSMARAYVPMTQNGSLDMQEFLRAKLQKGYRNCYALLIMILERNSQYNDIHRLALEAVGAAVDDDGFFSYYVGLSAFQLGAYDEALFFLEQCIKKNPEFTQAYLILATTLKKTGRDQAALRFLQQSLQLQQSRGEYLFPMEEVRLQVF